MIWGKASPGFDDTDKGLSRPQPRQAAGFDDTDKGLSQPQPLQAAGFDDLGKSDPAIFDVSITNIV